MDIFGSDAYLSGMFARVLSMLVILSIAVVTTIGAAHAARMDGMQADHALHPVETPHASTVVHSSCEGGQHCGSAEAVMCDVVCAGLPVLLTSPDMDAGVAYGPAGHDLPAEEIHAGRVPGLNKRPPKPRLL
ncbi:hypothetical protein [Ponticoccus sp. (in: a-proteobacteria)]|uniref:hypothetical protein n=1 Tax=Ponticoccus sp. (in: a-proteobacteria) TaxID=1925025 RepID=UPI003AB8CF75